MSEWTLEYRGFDPAQEGLREALCTLGNGYFATRGAAGEAEAGEFHYPGTYLAGGYNRLSTEIAGRVVENEDLVNLPNWLCLTFRPEGGDWFNLMAVELLDYRQCLDIESGVLKRQLFFRDHQGRETTLITQRLVHMAQPHLGAIEWRIRPENWAGRITVRSALDGRVINAGVARYRQLASTHLAPLSTDESGDDTICLQVETRQSKLRIAQAARTRLRIAGQEIEGKRQSVEEAGYIAQEMTFELAAGGEAVVEKVVALHTSRDRAIAEPGLAACQAVTRAGAFDELLNSHRRAWQHLWQRCDIGLDGGGRVQMILRLHIFHLLQTVSPHSVDLDVGVPARGLHGEAYRGHIFWDELFIFPFLNYRIPEITRALLRYRYRRLDEARHLACQAGYRGAMYPWQSGSEGREESQQVHLNPKSGRWIPDNSSLQRHVNAAVAYNVWRYYEVTEDREFLAYYGAEMLFEIARFWASAASWNAQRKRYDIRGVMGPDEFHDRYPDAQAPGLDNNTYTNVMAAWVLGRAVNVYDLIGERRRGELNDALALSDREVSQWMSIGQQLFVPFHADGVPSQFEGYEGLQEFDWAGYRERYGDIHRLDRLLEAEGDTVNRYKASKQADVLMLFYLFSAEELGDIFAQLGYSFSGELIPRTIGYYQQRTSHGSTLSRVVTSWVLARADRLQAWDLFQQVLQSDIEDSQGGTTAEGIHLGAMAGSVDLIQRGHTGLEVRDGMLRLNPCLPEALGGLHLRLRYRGCWLELDLEGDRLTLTAPESWVGPERIMFRDEIHPFGAGQRLELHYSEEERCWQPNRDCP
ncbi:trehalose/maltose hydrolase-like predicted phosphorylase [Modicisalibacter xianhensis]|uniref:Trehalose/maltose hydrolase-like predicted phosphorylase n=1 Tax=Modicisalibacter xianhensis TaxID=442341 RepID=A0A4R8G3J6_9GAMM|nr:glycosyl hydrolase family 65 protein [Halomonas xianhensis]TDX31053.1 trehalose/maltose hydrolase-like predicted phosphorylase [Halomonas xianhensis]